jgi:hypothetical protein
MYDKVGKAALRFTITYLRRRYRREIRIGVGLGAIAIGIAIYLANRDVPEG